jgi:hypothetical protein
MKIACFVVFMSALLLTACESTDAVLAKIDHTVPSFTFSPDTLEVDAGAELTLTAVVGDESGLQRIEFAYGDWRINEIIDLSNDPGAFSYPFSLVVRVPADAKKEWEESAYFNDGSSIKIIQRYHKLAITAWDKNRNLNKTYWYIKVK